MIDYPKQDQKIEICTIDGTIVNGMVNIAGRSLSTYLQDSEPDIIMYDAYIDKKKCKTLMITKKQIIWISTEDDGEKDWLGNWRRLLFKMINGQIVTGEIDITGYDRISDYIQRFNTRYYELFDSGIDGKKRKTLFISRRYTVWKELIENNP